MKDNNKDFLKDWLVKMSEDIKEDLLKYDMYIHKICGEKKSSHIDLCLREESSLFNRYKELYKLRIETDRLTVLIKEK